MNPGKQGLFFTLISALVFFFAQQPIHSQDAPESDKEELENSLFGDDDVFSDSAETGTEPEAEEEEDLEDSLFGSDTVFSDEEDGTGETADEEDEDSLFGSDMFVEADDTGDEEPVGSDLLVDEELYWGGSFRGSLSAEWMWEDYWLQGIIGRKSDSSSLSPSVASELFFDARPARNFRAYGKLDLTGSAPQQFGDFAQFAGGRDITENDLPEGWTLEENEDGDTEVIDAQGDVFLVLEAEDEDDETGEDGEEEEDAVTGSPLEFEISIFELFADFNIKEQFFFRFGKHTIKWGVGYFWSPADVLNLTAIDQEDPQAEREGPVSLKVNYPFSFHTLYLYVITNTGIKPIEAAVAPKAEFLVGNTEFSIAGYYQKALSPRGILTFSSSYGGVDFFGEGVVSIGSDRVFVRPSKDQSAAEDDPEDDLEVVLDTYEQTKPFFFLTTGFRYAGSLDNDQGSIFVIGQYFFNGEGYRTSRLLKPAYYLFLNPETNGLILPEEAQGEDYEEPPDLTFADLSPFGRHYIGTSFSWSGILGSNLTVSALGFMNMNDISGILIPSASYTFFDRLTLTGSLRMTFGNIGDEFTNPSALAAGNETGPTFAFSLEASFSERF
ncbi:MAG: hypothetical protein ACLFSE_03620 [Spirochaetia bacterium]